MENCYDYLKPNINKRDYLKIKDINNNMESLGVNMLKESLKNSI